MARATIEISARNNILKQINKQKPGTIFNYEDFADCGNYSNIRSAVVRLCETGNLIRVAQGLYMKPYDSTKEMPSHLEIVKEIARRTHTIAVPKTDIHGNSKKVTAEAKKLFFDTDGSTRKIKLYDGTVIHFYHKIF